MIQLDLLDVLYRRKVEAQQKLEALEETRSHELPVDEADIMIRIRELNISNTKGIIEIYANIIKSYLAHHS